MFQCDNLGRCTTRIGRMGPVECLRACRGAPRVRVLTGVKLGRATRTVGSKHIKVVISTSAGELSSFLKVQTRHIGGLVRKGKGLHLLEILRVRGDLGRR